MRPRLRKWTAGFEVPENALPKIEIHRRYQEGLAWLVSKHGSTETSSDGGLKVSSGANSRVQNPMLPAICSWSISIPGSLLRFLIALRLSLTIPVFLCWRVPCPHRPIWQFDAIPFDAFVERRRKDTDVSKGRLPLVELDTVFCDGRHSIPSSEQSGRMLRGTDPCYARMSRRPSQ